MEHSNRREKEIDYLFLGDQETRAMARSYPWGNSSFGPPRVWSQCLRSTADLVLSSPFPMFLAWGPELNIIYNDAYIPILQDRHPHAFMEPMQTVWVDVWESVGAKVKSVFAGESCFLENFNAEIKRHGIRQTRWFTFSYSPLRDDHGAIAGLLCIVNETTEKIQTEARQTFRLRLAEELRSLADPAKITALASRLLGEQLGASRVLYLDIDDANCTFEAHHDWTDGTISSVTGITGCLSDFGDEFMAGVHVDSSCVIENVATDPRTRHRAGEYARIGVVSLINVPVVKEGRLIAALSVHSSTTRQWSDPDVELAEIICDYTWPAVERSRAQKALQDRIRTEANRLKELFEVAPSPMVVFREPDMKIEMANEAYYKWVGRTDLIGKSLWKALPEVAGQGFEELLNEVYQTGKPYVGHGLKVSLQPRADALPIDAYHDVLYQPLFGADGEVNGIFVLANDVTEAYRAQTALRESEERLREGTVAARMVVWDWDFVAGSVRMSENATDVLGGTWTITEDLFQFVHLDDKPRLQNAQLQATPKNPRYITEFRLIRPDNGQTIWLETSGQMLFDVGGNPSYVKGVTLDITKRKENEEELRQADQQKDEFLAMLGHELRNPLAPIRSAAELIKFARLDEKKLQASSEIIIRQVDHMTELVDDLLDVSRVTRGLVTLEKSAVDLKQVVSKAVEQINPLTEARHHRLTIHSTTESTRTCGDEKRLVQILANLLNNASKYTPEGGEIDLQMEVVERSTQIRVQDNGIGITEDLLPRVFELFRQGERSSDRTQGGLGLGLALVKSLMELHGGTVQADSPGAGMGSTFTLTFPPLDFDTTLSSSQQVPAQERTAGRRLRIMVVDDNTDAALMLQMVLEVAGHEAIAVHTAQGALKEAGQAKIDVCLLDIGLPDTNGYDLVPLLRAIPRMAHTKMIAVTGYGQQADIQAAMEAGFDVHLVKPIDTHRLFEILETI